MWIASEKGFFSIVQDKDDARQLVIRARRRKDLVALVGWLELTIESTPDRDYQYRCYVTRELGSRIVDDLVRDIRYDNFKNWVAYKGDRQYAKVLGWAWSTFYTLGRR